MSSHSDGYCFWPDEYSLFEGMTLDEQLALAGEYLFELRAIRNPYRYSQDYRCLPPQSSMAISATKDRGVRINFASVSAVRMVAGEIDAIEDLLGLYKTQQGLPLPERVKDVFKNLEREVLSFLDRMRGADCVDTADLRAMGRDGVHLPTCEPPQPA